MGNIPQAYDLFEQFGTKFRKSGVAVGFTLDEERGDIAGTCVLPEGRVVLRYDPTRQFRVEATTPDGKLIERIKLDLPQGPDELLYTLFGKKRLGSVLQREAPQHYASAQEISDIFATAGDNAQWNGLIDGYSLLPAADAEALRLRGTAPNPCDPNTVFCTYDLANKDRILELHSHLGIDAGDGMNVGIRAFDRTSLNRAVEIGDVARNATVDAPYQNAVLLIERSPEAVGLIVQAFAGVTGAKDRLDAKLSEWPHYLR